MIMIPVAPTCSVDSTVVAMGTRTGGGDFDYETGGEGYELRRRADPQIEAQVHAALGGSATVLNVGAGAGSYEPRDRYVAAVEPSVAMRAKRAATGRVPAIDAAAELLPFDDDSFDAAMAIVTVHQWSDWQRGVSELRRVSRGPVVILTFDAPALADFWLFEYAPELVHAEVRRFPAIDDLVTVLGGQVRVDTVPIPLECTDGIIEAFYGRPEMFLRSEVRRAQSGWGFVGDDVEERAVAALGSDLADGTWDSRHGHLRAHPTFTGSLRLVVAP